MIEAALSVIGIFFWMAWVVLFVWVVVVLRDLKRLIAGMLIAFDSCASVVQEAG